MPFWACRRFSASSQTTDCGAVHHRRRHLVAAMRRQAVHEQRVGLGAGHQLFVDPIGGEFVVALLALLHAHRNPGVGHHQVGILDRVLRRCGEHHLAALLTHPLQQATARPERARPGQAQAEAETDGRLHPRPGDIVGIAAPGDRAAGDAAAVLLVGHHVGHQLARMRLVGQAVDHRDGRVLREFRQFLRIVGPDHDRIDVAGEHARRVRHALAAAHLRASSLRG